MTEAQDYNTIRAQVKQQFHQRYGFYFHLLVYLLVSTSLWFVYGFTANQWQLLKYPIIGILVIVPLILSIPWPLFIMIIWGMVLVAHGIESSVHRKIVINREIEREYARGMIYEKPKNDAHMGLTDDGELEEVLEDEDHSVTKPKRQ